MTYHNPMYEIRKGKHSPCELVSVFKVGYGKESVNFIAEGTHTECQRILNAITGKAKQ